MREDYEFDGEKIGNTKQYLMLKRLIEGVFNNIGINKLLKIIEEILSKPVIIIDMGFRVVVESPSVTKNIRYHYVYRDNIFLNEACIKEIRSHYLYSKMREREFSSAVIKHENLGDFLVASIKVSEADVLMLITFNITDKYDNLEMLLIKKICQVMSVEFQKENSFNRYRLAMPNHIMAELISGSGIDKEEFIDKMSYLKWVKEDYFYIMLLEDIYEEKLDLRISSVIHSLKAYIPIEHCMMYKSMLVIYLTKDLYNKISIEEKLEFKKFLENNDLRAAVGPGFSNILESKKYYDITLETLSSTRKFKISLGIFDEMKFYIIADLLENKYEIREFCHPAIISLIQFDRENNTELLLTLFNYLTYKTNIEVALEKLYIHRSTLFYRVKKIKEITGINLDETDEITRLFFSLKLVEIYGKDKF